MFVKHFEDEQHHKSAMYYYYTFSWNILHFLKKQVNQLSAQRIDTMPSTDEYGEKQNKTVSKHFQTEGKKSIFETKPVSSLYPIYSAVHLQWILFEI